MVWYSCLFKNFLQFVVTHKVKGFSIINEAEVFMEFSCFFYDPMDAGNLISGFSVFSKTSLNLEVQMEVHGSRIAEAWLGEF